MTAHGSVRMADVRGCLSRARAAGRVLSELMSFTLAGRSDAHMRRWVHKVVS